MILNELSVPVLQSSDTQTLESGWQTLSNYRVAACVFEVTDKPITAALIGKNGADGAEENIRFRYRENTALKWLDADAEGKEFAERGQYVVCVTADSLARQELDRVKLTLAAEAGEKIGTVCFLLAEPRYSGLPPFSNE